MNGAKEKLLPRVKYTPGSSFRVETAGRDHIIISDSASGKRYLLLMANLDWVEFGEQINYPHMEISPEVQASLDISE